jgi:hypothetical protein
MSERSSDIGGMIGEVVAEGASIGIATSGWIAYKNHVARTGNRQEALYLAALTARRWWTWYFFVFGGVIMTLVAAWGLFFIHVVMADNNGQPYDYYNHDPHSGTIAWMVRTIVLYAAAWLVLGVIYCRNIDSGMYRRRWVYKTLKPLYVITQPIPSFFLYLAIPVSQFIF